MARIDHLVRIELKNCGQRAAKANKATRIKGYASKTVASDDTSVCILHLLNGALCLCPHLVY